MTISEVRKTPAIEIQIEKISDLRKESDGSISLPAYEEPVYFCDIEEKTGISMQELAETVFANETEPCIVSVRCKDGKIRQVAVGKIQNPAYIFNAKAGEMIRVTTPNYGRGALTRYFVDKKIDAAPGSLFNPGTGKSLDDIFEDKARVFSEKLDGLIHQAVLS